MLQPGRLMNERVTRWNRQNRTEQSKEGAENFNTRKIPQTVADTFEGREKI